jgi:two-component system, NarL family, response regulator LiaR
MSDLKVLIVEDETITRTALQAGLLSQKEDLSIFEAENGQQALEITRREKPSIVLMDIRMPIMDGVTATQHIKQEFGDTIKVIMLTSSQEEKEVFAALTAGADAYCTKDIRMVRLLQVIEMILEGAVWLDPAIAKIISTAFPAMASTPQSEEKTSGRQRYNPNLTERETDVLNLLAEGKANKEIANELHLSINTVKTHVRSIINKMAVDSRTQAALKALQLKSN